MSKMKAEATDLVEKVLKKFGQFDSVYFRSSLTKELLEIGPDAFVEAYLAESKLPPPEHWWSQRPPSSSISTRLSLIGPLLMDISTSESCYCANKCDGSADTLHGVFVHIATPKGAAEIYFNDPDTVMKVMAALAKAGSILGGKTDGYSDSASA